MIKLSPTTLGQPDGGPYMLFLLFFFLTSRLFLKYIFVQIMRTRLVKTHFPIIWTNCLLNKSPILIYVDTRWYGTQSILYAALTTCSPQDHKTTKLIGTQLKSPICMWRRPLVLKKERFRPCAAVADILVCLVLVGTYVPMMHCYPTSHQRQITYFPLKSWAPWTASITIGELTSLLIRSCTLSWR
jgi:hypothetical protein